MLYSKTKVLDVTIRKSHCYYEGYMTLKGETVCIKKITILLAYGLLQKRTATFKIKLR